MKAEELLNKHLKGTDYEWKLKAIKNLNPGVFDGIINAINEAKETNPKHKEKIFSLLMVNDQLTSKVDSLTKRIELLQKELEAKNVQDHSLDAMRYFVAVKNSQDYSVFDGSKEDLEIKKQSVNTFFHGFNAGEKLNEIIKKLSKEPNPNKTISQAHSIEKLESALKNITKIQGETYKNDFIADIVNEYKKELVR